MDRINSNRKEVLSKIHCPFFVRTRMEYSIFRKIYFNSTIFKTTEMKQCTIKHIPSEILMIIIEMLILRDSYNLCEVLNISQELAFQYFHYKSLDNYTVDRYVFDLRKKMIKPNLAKALLKNSGFQAKADERLKLKFAILSQDLELVRNALKDFKQIKNDSSPLYYASYYGQLDVVKFLVNEWGYYANLLLGSIIYCMQDGIF